MAFEKAYCLLCKKDAEFAAPDKAGMHLSPATSVGSKAVCYRPAWWWNEPAWEDKCDKPRPIQRRTSERGTATVVSKRRNWIHALRSVPLGQTTVSWKRMVKTHFVFTTEISASHHVRSTWNPGSQPPIPYTLNFVHTRISVHTNYNMCYKFE